MTVETQAAEPSRSEVRARRWVGAMLVLSIAASSWAGVVGVAQLVGLAKGETEQAPTPGLVAALIGVVVVALAKAVIEYRGWSRLRRPGAVISPETRVLAKVWLPALLLLALHVAYFTVILVIGALGLILGVMGTIFTLGFGWRQAWDNGPWNLAHRLGRVLELEGEALNALTSHPAGELVLGLFLVVMLFGPTLAALLVVRRSPA